MAISIQQLVEKANSKVFPKASKVERDSQFLEPASHDKNARKTSFGEPELLDYDKFIDVSFTAGKNMGRDKSKVHVTTSDGNPQMPVVEEEVQLTEAQEDVIDLYRSDSWHLLDAVADLMAALEDSTPYHYAWKDISSLLKETRDKVLRCIPAVPQDVPTPGQAEETQKSDSVYEGLDLSESINPGKLKLKDGTTITVSRKQANVLNDMLSSTKNRSAMMNDLMKSKSDFNDMVEFASNIEEELDLTEGKRLISTEKHGKNSAKVYWNSDDKEYCVKLYRDGKYQSKADYFTDEAKDALDTAKRMIKEGYDDSKSVLGAADPEMDSDKKKKDVKRALSAFRGRKST